MDVRPASSGWDAGRRETAIGRGRPVLCKWGRQMRIRELVAPVLLAGVLPLAWPRAAAACGGFFCDQQQANSPLPIAQAAENVLFVMDTDPQTGGKRVEAHIQILYTGAAAQFSWIVLVTSVPTVDVGPDILFDRMEPVTG